VVVDFSLHKDCWRRFSHGMAAVKKDIAGHWGCVNATGDIAIPADYRSVGGLGEAVID